jgi:CheY-like chemotaxis protein
MSATPTPPPSRTVLVVDDEDDLREIMCYSLQRRGFTTLAAAEPHEAVEVCRDHDGPIDVLITDLNLPGLPGVQLAALLTAMRPQLRVLYASGWSRDAAMDRGLVDDRATMVQKPFTPDQLAEAVRTVLSAAVPPAVQAASRRS